MPAMIPILVTRRGAMRALMVLGILSTAAAPASEPRVAMVSPGGTVTVAYGERTLTMKPGEEVGPWTLMGIVGSGTKQPAAVFEDFSQSEGCLLVLGPGGQRTPLPKSLEPTWAAPQSLYLGHRLDQVFNSDRDLLGDELLARPGDPKFAEVAACFPPISKMSVYTFVGAHDTFEKVGIFYGGSTPNFDPAAYVPAIEPIRKATRVLDGLVGGWLPVIRFVYPQAAGTWSELLIFAPIRVENANSRVQPAWYRISHIEQNHLRWVRYFDSYHPFPPRESAPAERFYQELLAMRTYWESALAGGMQVHLPDVRLENLARHSLIRGMMTRIGSFPKYGVFDRSYGGSEHDGFPDTFTAETAAAQEWGLTDLARQYIDNYFANFVRDDGSILYRGPETGQFGRMLTVLAEYANYTGDEKLLLRHRARIDAVANLLLGLREKALRRPPDDPAYGLIAGWSEADACLDPDPPRYMQPYFGNSTEAARGWGDLGAVFERWGHGSRRQHLSDWGRKLQKESVALIKDVQLGIARSVLTNTQPVCLPAIAGAKEPFDVACRRDGLDPQFRSYRAYMEMLYSGNLTRDQVRWIVDYRRQHRDTLLGIPTAYGYNTHELAGFLSYGHAYGLLQHDFPREFLLTLYSLEAHQYTRGAWTAPETRRLDPKQAAAPYCTPAQMVAPLLTRWMLVFEDPATQALWLAKAVPRAWLESGQTISVANAPTRWGPVDFEIHSRLSEGKIDARLRLPLRSSPAALQLRLRAPAPYRIKSVLLNQKPWTQFDPEEETVQLPPTLRGRVELTVSY